MGSPTIDVPATWPRALTRKWDAVVGVGHSSPVIAGTRVVVHTRQGTREVIAGLRSRHRRAALAGRLRRAVSDEPGRAAARPRAQVHAGHRRRARVRARDQRRAVGPRSRDRQGAVADAGRDDAAALRHGDVARWRTATASSRSWAGTIAGRSRPSTPRPGPCAGAGPATAPAYSSPIVAELGGTRQVITQSQNRLVGVGGCRRRAAVGGAVPHQLRPELGHAAGGRTASSSRRASRRPTIAYRVTRGPRGGRRRRPGATSRSRCT